MATKQNATKGQGTIVNLSTLQQIGSLDINSSADGQSIYVLNNIAYLTASDGFLYAFNINSRNGSHNFILTSKIALAGVGKRVVVANVGIKTYAYIATASKTTQFQIIDVTNITTTAPSVAASINVSNVANNQQGVDVYIDSTSLRAYLVINASGTKSDFFTINVDPSSINYKQILNFYTTTNSMDPTGVVFVSGNKAIIVGTGGTRNYQVIDVSVENVPAQAVSTSLCQPGWLATSYNIYGIATLFSHALRTYSYILTDDSGNEFKVIEGGTGGGGGSGNGITVSTTFDALHNVAFNYFTGTVDPDLSYKVDIEQAIGNVCPTTFNNYVTTTTGPLALPGTSYTNPGQCMSYEVINSGTTAKAYTVTFNYSP